MKKLVVSILLLFLALGVYSQDVTAFPEVDYQTKLNFGVEKLLGVCVDDSRTVVFWEYTSYRNAEDVWLSLSSKTSLTSSMANIYLRIIEWGTYDDDGFYPLSLDERYLTKNSQRYKFYMIFPAVPKGIEKITIRENVNSTGEFFWEGIHINNSNPYSSYSGSSNYPRYGSNYSGNSSSYSREFVPSGSGTCFALNSAGLLATCYHVVEGASGIQIRGVNGDFNRVYNAKVVVVDAVNDLAIVKIDDYRFNSLGSIPYTLSNWTIDVGNDVYVLGYPLRAAMGDEIKLTNGLISSQSGFQGDITSYQISAAVQPGNSGGPLFDKNGNIVGVVSSKLTIAESASYAVKSTYLKNLISKLGYNVTSGTNTVYGKTLAEQVKAIKKFVYIIEVR